MSICQKLFKLVNDEMIPEVEDFVDKLFELVNSKKATEDDKEALSEARELLKSFRELIEDIESGEIDEEECQETFDDLNSISKD